MGGGQRSNKWCFGNKVIYGAPVEEAQEINVMGIESELPWLENQRLEAKIGYWLLYMDNVE